MVRAMNGRRARVRQMVMVAGALLALALAAWPVRSVAADGPRDDVAAADAAVQRALQAARSGDLATARREYQAFEQTWFAIEDGVRDSSKAAYRAIEAQMSAVEAAFTATPAVPERILAALNALAGENSRFVQGLPPEKPSSAAETPPATNGRPTVATLLDELAAARMAAQGGDFAAASARFAGFQETWLDVEGQVKTRSATAYRDTESDAARAASLLAASSPQAVELLDAMHARLTPYVDAGRYGVFDATIILLREGLEALLVLVALLAFLKKSGNADKGRWVWGGAGAGLAASLVLGIGIHLLFSSVVDGANRELMEGLTGLAAAAMLLYISYWLHNQTSIGSWQRYLSVRTTAALARGSLLGLGLLAFLAVFREGAETVLFMLGMAGDIALRDLALGLAAGAGFLAVLGVLLLVVGVRIPMRPFFAVASLLTFYLCFKFVGTGIHALQVADVVQARAETFLPSSETLGLFPTWETTLSQLLLLATALAVFLRTRLRDRGLGHEHPLPISS